MNAPPSVREIRKRCQDPFSLTWKSAPAYPFGHGKTTAQAEERRGSLSLEETCHVCSFARGSQEAAVIRRLRNLPFLGKAGKQLDCSAEAAFPWSFRAAFTQAVSSNCRTPGAPKPGKQAREPCIMPPDPAEFADTFARNAHSPRVCRRRVPHDGPHRR
jgi:hypothetical protein